MSHEELAAQVKQAATESVREALVVSDHTRVRVSIGVAVSIVCTIIGSVAYGTWVVGHYLDAISIGQERMETALSYKVNEGQFRAWTYALDKANRTIDPSKGLIVPELSNAPASSPPERSYPPAN